MIGHTIAHYKILDKLGQGGMGVVYKAEDTKLNRTVALKFLPTQQLATPDDKLRFEQEAKAAAQLSHANIATVFEINEYEGQTFIAMEYIEGGTLADKVRARPMKLKDALKIASQVAAGLHTAHEQGIVHRDIKSANIMLTQKGVVKIMDFGLAKMSQTSMKTKAGTTLGTISYMSPEQASGEGVDRRSDIWSLGVVLYEMISGQLPFKGDYEQAIVFSILNEEPEPLTAVRTGVPMDLERIVNKLLAKDPDNRYQNIVELPVDLKNVSLKDISSAGMGSSGISQGTRASVVTSSISQKKQLNVKFTYTWRNILTIAAAVLLTFLLTWFLKPGPAPPAKRTTNKSLLMLPHDSVFRYRWTNGMAISPDGTRLAIMARAPGFAGLLIKNPGSFELERLAATENAVSPFFSPDGRWVGYFNEEDGRLYKILPDGGEPLTIAPAPDFLNGAAWASDNSIIVSTREGLKHVSASGGETSALTKSEEPKELHLFPSLLPGGKTVLFTVRPAGAGLNSARLAVYRMGDATHRIILNEEGYNGVYSATGHILYGRADRLMGVPFDPEKLEITGQPIPVLQSVDTHGSGGMYFAISREGKMVYAPDFDIEDDERTIVTVDASGVAARFLALHRNFRVARSSPDGRYVAFVIFEGDVRNIWVYHIDGGALNQLTYYESRGVRWLAWSPDSKAIAFGTTAEDSTNSLFVQRIDGTGSAQKIYTSPFGARIDVFGWTADGRNITFDQPVSDGNWDCFVYSFEDSSVTTLRATPAFEALPTISPNGKWFAYQSNETGEMEVYVRPVVDGGSEVWKISDNGGQEPAWARNGEKIYYKSRQAMYGVAVTTANAFSKQKPQKLFDGNYFLSRGRSWDIHPDGDRFIMIQSPVAAEPSTRGKLYLIEHFDEELRRLIPAQ